MCARDLMIRSMTRGMRKENADRSRARRPAINHSQQALEQQLELADLDLAFERVVGQVEDGDGQRAVVAVALEEVDGPAVLDLALADADLELAGGLAGVAEVDV